MSSSATPLKGSSRVIIEPGELFALQHQARAFSLSSGAMLARSGGGHTSRFRGRGMEYEESRLYQPGDDIRTIDWRVTARTGATHTKLFRDERERPVLIWLDYRSSMFFATAGSFKSVLAARSAALLAWIGQQNGDRVGGMIFNNHNHHEYRPRRGRQSLLAFLQAAADQQQWRSEVGAEADEESHTSSSTTLETALRRLLRLARPGSLLFLVSDFRGLTGQRSDPARQLLNRLADHSELFLHQIYDPLEEKLPERGRYPVTDGRRQFLLKPDAKTAMHHRDAFLARQQALEALAGRAQVGLLAQTTSEDSVALLQSRLPRIK